MSGKKGIVPGKTRNKGLNKDQSPWNLTLLNWRTGKFTQLWWIQQVWRALRFWLSRALDVTVYRLRILQEIRRKLGFNRLRLHLKTMWWGLVTLVIFDRRSVGYVVVHCTVHACWIRKWWPGGMGVSRANFSRGIQLTHQKAVKTTRTWWNEVILVNLCRILHKLINLCRILHKLPLEG